MRIAVDARRYAGKGYRAQLRLPRRIEARRVARGEKLRLFSDGSDRVNDVPSRQVVGAAHFARAGVAAVESAAFVEE